MSNRTLSNTAYSTLATYIEYLFGLLASILTARALLPSDLGIYSLLVWIVANAVVVANAGITLGAIKFIAELQGAGQEDLVAVLVRRLQRLQRNMLLVVTVAIALVFVLVRHRLAPGVDAWLLALLVASVALRAPYMFNVAVLKGNRDFRAIALVAAVGASFNLAMVVLAWSQSATLPVFVVIFAASGVVFHLISHRRASRLTGAAPVGAVLPAELEARVRHHLRIVGVTTVLGTIGSSEIELLSLNLLADPAHAGLFKVANALATGVVLLVPGVLSAQLLPLMASAQGRGQGEAERRFVGMSAWLLLLGAPLLSYGVVLSGSVIGLLYGSAYAAAAPVFAVLLVARVASMLGQGATAYLLSADRQTALMRLTLLFTALRFAGAFGCTYAFGLYGAIGSTALLALLGSAVTIRLAMRTAHSPLPWARLARVVIAATVPALVCLPLAHAASPFMALLGGSAVFAVGYPLGLWLMHGLGEEDIGRVRAVMARLGFALPVRS